MRKRRKKNRFKVIAGLTVIAILICSIAVFTKQEARFILNDIYSRLQTNEIKKVIPIKETETKSITLEKLKSYPNVTVDESMLLVNEEYRISENYEPDTVEYEERAVTVNTCVTEAFSELSNALAAETGETLYISSAVRSFERQKEIKTEEGVLAQNPGASEHQTGLAVDVYVQYYAGESFIKSESGQFINSNCDDYGFIIRYPFFGKAKTGIGYEPWHLRYVGLPHAKIISNSLITYEQYVEFFETDVFYEYDGYLISRQKGNDITIPDNFESAVVSEDNTGHIFLTFDMTE